MGDSGSSCAPACKLSMLLFIMLFGCVTSPVVQCKFAYAQSPIMWLSLHIHVASDWWMQIYIGRPQRLDEPVTTGRISSDPDPNSPAKTTGTNPIGVGPSIGESKLNLTFCTAPWICVEPHPCYCCVMPKKCYISMEKCRANCLNCDPKCPAKTTWEG